MKVFAGLIIIGLWLAAVCGWVANIVKLFHLSGVSTEFVLRVIGIFVAPFGAIGGYL